MEETAVNLAAVADTEVYELSIMHLFWQADIVVKTVMIMLIVASVWCWAIIIDKTMRISKVSRKASKFEEAFWSGGSLDDLYDRIGTHPADPMSSIFVAAMKEWRHASNRALASNGGVNLYERIDRVMQVTLSREIGRLERHLTFLATVGSSATFVGLFGTVWGIMNSFTAIAASKQTSLAVVAPGIAEALFATALGLVAAIPATVAYNKISSDLGKLAGRLDGFSGEFSAIISRQLDEGK
ncbi:protein TolQ [Curvivirga sp.]|uniref:protein TolQ n=1 Tax=Curvivirga sp. TaxID=2856848 RepID=UPI003B5CB639